MLVFHAVGQAGQRLLPQFFLTGNFIQADQQRRTQQVGVVNRRMINGRIAEAECLAFNHAMQILKQKILDGDSHIQKTLFPDNFPGIQQGMTDTGVICSTAKPVEYKG